MAYDLASVYYILETNRSVRKRLDLTRPVDRAVMMECLGIALQAPSGGNAQGWRWLIVTNADKRAKIGEYYRRSIKAYSKGGRIPGRGNQDPNQQNKVYNSASYLADHMGEVPMMIFDCIHGRQ